MPHNVAVYYSRRQRLHTLLNRKSASARCILGKATSRRRA